MGSSYPAAWNMTLRRFTLPSDMFVFPLSYVVATCKNHVVFLSKMI